MVRAGRKANPKLQRLLHLKSFTLTYLCLASMLTLLKLDSGFHYALLINIAYSILNATTYFYFTSFWQIARGYDFVNHEMEELLKALRSGRNTTKYSALRDLWSLHANLSVMARRINRVYGIQMMVSRTDYVVFTIIYDFFLNDLVCDLISRYQCLPKHDITEGKVTQQLSAYLIYEGSMRLDLKVSGLFSANKSQWLRMMGCIVCHCTLLLQFYVMLRN
ncbi:putative gustatory receptor 59b [Drosophila biarmipes]|uniref:putative gustatory receptor 59b n=1 Tax=Drosophila biarmipes TaxID=125945 RepID=UPI0007E634A3|nr:putative gustatory receptor 59b [Drosophila biarmipes]